MGLLTSECHGQHQNNSGGKKASWLYIISRKMSSTAMNRATATTAEIFSNKMTANQEKAGASHQTQIHQSSHHQALIHQSSHLTQIHLAYSNQIPNPILTAEIASKGVAKTASC